MTSLSGSEDASPVGPLPFVVMVDDNFHYMDEDERWKLGAYATLDQAISACKNMVEACLADYCKPGMNSEQLYDQYVMFGDDPFILGPGDPVKFSAWDYAKARAHEVCGSNSTPGNGDSKDA